MKEVKRLFCIFIIIAIISIAGIYAYGTSTPSNLGHSLGELETCGDGQILQTIGGAWVCADSAGDAWSESGSNIYFTGGNVGIGVTGPSSLLDVEGTTESYGFQFLSGDAVVADWYTMSSYNSYCSSSQWGEIRRCYRTNMPGASSTRYFLCTCMRRLGTYKNEWRWAVISLQVLG